MGKGLGIAAFVLVLMAFFVPVFGVFVSGLALIVAAFGALLGEKIFTTTSVVVAGINTFFLSPSVWMAYGGSDATGRTELVETFVVLLAAPFVTMIIGALGRAVLGHSGR